MSYTHWRSRLGKGIVTFDDPALAAVADALRAYSANPLQDALAALASALQAWRRKWPSDTVSSADPTQELYLQVSRVSSMPMGDPGAIADRLAYETRVRLLTYFGNLQVNALTAADAFKLVEGTVSIAFAFTGVEDNMKAPLKAAGLPVPMVNDIMGKATSGYKTADGFASADTAFHNVRADRRNQSSEAQVNPSKATRPTVDIPASAETAPSSLLQSSLPLPSLSYSSPLLPPLLIPSPFLLSVASRLPNVEAMFQKLLNLVKKLFSFVKDWAVHAFGVYTDKMLAYMDSADGFCNDMCKLLLEAIVPGHQFAYMAASQSAYMQLGSVIDGVLQKCAGKTATPPTNSALHAGILASVKRGQYWSAWEAIIQGVLAIVKAPVAVASGAAAGLYGLFNSLASVVVKMLVRWWERSHLRAVAKESRAKLLASGWRAGDSINLSERTIAAARDGAEFDKWFLAHLRAPAVGSLVLHDDVCDAAAFFWVFDGHGYVQESAYLTAHMKLSDFKAKASGYLRQRGLWHRTSVPSKLTDAWEVPESVRMAVMAKLPAPVNHQLEMKEKTQKLARKVEYFAMRH